MKKIIVLGSTGSIGRQTLEIVEKYSHEFKIIGLTGGENWQLLKKQIQKFQPQFIATNFAEKFDLDKVKILPLNQLAQKKCDLIVSAISGAAGLLPTLSALEAGNNIALANKESLVLAGGIVMKAARKSGAKIFPLDSEHSGIWQLLEKINSKKVRKIILTASGGALRQVPLKNLKHATPTQVLAHPNWQMGTKVTVDSSTLANKAFEVIEAHHLFGIPYEKIEVLIHPQSLVHALVETIDGNVFAQLANPDMRLPIQQALFGGERKPSLVNFLDLNHKQLEFYQPDWKRYPLFQLILETAKKPDFSIVVATMATEIAVKKFLAGEIGYLDMHAFVKKALKNVPQKPFSLKNIFRIIQQFSLIK